MMDNTNELDKNISDGDDSNSDPDYSDIETESDDTSIDEFISKDDDPSDSDSTGANQACGRIPAINIMKAKPGAVTSVAAIMDTFKLFMTDKILNEIIFHTNRYAKRYLHQQEQKRSECGGSQTILFQWKDLDHAELEAFLGLLIQSGIGHSNHESITQLWDISDSLPILYQATMSSHRFKDLLRFLRFDHRQRRDKSDRLAPIWFILECFTKQLPRHFTPIENLTIDEQLVPFRGHCFFVQYMLKKPSKYGLEFWLLCDA
ncbi:unnamed protein product [Rotaria magnacalcarata]|uniref:PiggyBac transposable element-derived protein domain-containing protein n=2 Tax=Rotaria magnacalcarata TaxID=392030 RepID=A0A819TQM9_9BILA|nr:unnamed protein product [Rotaria magnacalcarata]